MTPLSVRQTDKLEVLARRNGKYNVVDIYFEFFSDNGLCFIGEYNFKVFSNTMNILL